VVLVLLALQVLAHGVLLAATQQLRAARAAAHVVEARAAAQGAVNRALGSPTTYLDDSLPSGGAQLLSEERMGRVGVEVTAERLSHEAWLVGARGRVDDWVGSVGRARLAWVMAPVARVGDFRAVAHVGGGLAAADEGAIAGDVLPSSPTTLPGCSPWHASLDSLLPGRRLEPVVVDTTDALHLGLLDRTLLLERAAPEARDSVTPAPALRPGRCDGADPSNWGDPGTRSGPCSDHFVLRARRGSLRMVGGSGQGLLVVTGDLSLENGADFRGLALVGGALRLSGDSSVQGLVRVGGTLRLGENARLLGSACWAARSLDAVRERLAVMLPFPGWGWLTVP
jgi:hypothetical protein